MKQRAPKSSTVQSGGKGISIVARAVLLGIRCADGNNQMANWGGRYRARRSKRGFACPLVIGIATEWAGMDYLRRGAHLVLDQGRTIRLRRNGRCRQNKHRGVCGAA